MRHRPVYPSLLPAVFAFALLPALSPSGALAQTVRDHVFVKKGSAKKALPFRVNLVKVVRQGSVVHGRIHAVLDTEEMLNALDGRKGRLHIQIVTKLPSNPRVVLLDSEGAVAEDADEWTWDIPLTWSADSLRMTILAEEMVTGLKGSVTLDPSSWK